MFYGTAEGIAEPPLLPPKRVCVRGGDVRTEDERGGGANGWADAREDGQPAGRAVDRGVVCLPFRFENCIMRFENASLQFRSCCTLAVRLRTATGALTRAAACKARDASGSETVTKE